MIFSILAKDLGTLRSAILAAAETRTGVGQETQWQLLRLATPPPMFPPGWGEGAHRKIPTLPSLIRQGGGRAEPALPLHLLQFLSEWLMGRGWQAGECEVL